MKGLKCIHTLSGPQKFDRFASDMSDRQSRPATGIPIGFGQDHTGQGQSLVECLCTVDCILAGHAVDHEQCFHRLHCLVQFLYFRHHVVVYMQPARGIHNHHIDAVSGRMIQCTVDDIQRFLAGIRRIKTQFKAIRQSSQLIDSGWPVNVCTHHHHGFPCAGFDKSTQFTNGSGFAGAL